NKLPFSSASNPTGSWAARPREFEQKRVALKARGRLFHEFSGAKGKIAYPDAVFCAYHLFWPERALQSTAPSALIALIRRSWAWQPRLKSGQRFAPQWQDRLQNPTHTSGSRTNI